jgi:hypothetical protein
MLIAIAVREGCAMVEPEGVRVDGARLAPIQRIAVPDWVLKFSRRLMSLSQGNYVIVLTVAKDHKWTVARLGKIEE